MLASLLASFPFQLWFISSNSSIKHLVSSQQLLGAQFCIGCLFLREMKGKSMCFAHGEGAFVAGWLGRHTDGALGQSQGGGIGHPNSRLSHRVTNFLTCLNLYALPAGGG